MKNLYTKLMALVALLLALSGTCNTSFAQESGKKNDWKYGHFTSEAEYQAYMRGERGTRGVVETDPPTGNVRFPAEFEKMQGVIIAYHDLSGFGLPSDLIASLTQKGKVYILCGGKYLGFIPYMTLAQSAINNMSGVNASNVVYLDYEVDSYWTRDYGPWYIFNNNHPALVDVAYNRDREKDEVIPGQMAQYHNIPMYGMNVVHTGGNMMQDGRGTGVSTTLVNQENSNLGADGVAAKMQSYLGINPYYRFDNPQNHDIAHIDCSAKLLAPDKILIDSVPTSDANWSKYEAIANYFASTNCCYDYPYKVYRVFIPSSNGTEETLAPYSNSLILNNTVYVPLGDNSTYNAQALAVYQKAMPGYEIIGFTGSNSAPWLNTDAIHCRTRGIMDFNMMFVDHRHVIYGEEIAYQTNYTVNADLIAYSGAAVTTAQLVYRVNDGDWNYVNMTNTTGDTYTANIPGMFGASIDYYITATDANGNTGSQPMMGALDPHSFSIAENPLGYIDFEASTTTAALDQYVYFTNLTTMQFNDDFCQWTLEGADPETTGATNPIVQYHTPGTYDVTFSILDTETGEVLYSLTKEDYITVENAYLMHNGSVTTCDTKFYDNGGEGYYSPSQNTVFTFYPGGGERSRIQAEFVSFNTEAGYDALKVYDGTVANSSLLIGTYSGNTNPGTIVATNPEGALTFKFTSDRANCYDGWEANISCITPDYQVAVAACTNGSISTDLQMAFAGETINVTVTPAEGYNLESLYYLDADNIRTNIDLHMLAFAMPAKNVTVYATFSTMATQHDINISNGSSIADNVLFYDHGGPNANYSNRENYTYTFTPAVPGGFVQVEFLEFATESKYDKLIVSDGNGTIATLSGSNLPSRIISSTGSLTFYFKSDNSVNRAGWKAEVTTFVYQQYQIAVANVENGTITADKTAAFAGETVTLTATPIDDQHFFFAGWNVTCGDETIQVVNNQFIMPEGNVNVSGTFAEGYYTPAYYELVTNANDLEAGSKVLIVNTNTGSAYAMGEQLITSTNYGQGNIVYNPYRDAVNVTIVDGEGEEYGKHYIYDVNGATEFYLYGSTNSWNFYDEEEYGYLYCYRYKKLSSYVYSLNTIANSNYKNWDITFYNDGQVRVRNTSYLEDMGFGNNVFDVWSVTSQKKLYIFKRVEGYWTAGQAPERNDAITAVSENEINAKLYPNPTTGNLTIEAEGMNHISVFNLMGQMVYDMDVDTDNMTLDMSQFNTAGMYLVRINTVNGVKTERVTVTK